MEVDDECFICGESVCDKELLESMDLESVTDLSKSFSRIFIPTKTISSDSVSSSLYESYFDNAPLCYKCINRILDAHSLYNQINLLQIKVRAIQYDVHSLMKKREVIIADDGQKTGRAHSRIKIIISKFQQLRKDIVNSFTNPTSTKAQNKSKESSLTPTSIIICSDVSQENDTNTQDFDETNQESQEDIDISDIKFESDSLPLKRISSRVRFKPERYSDSECAASVEKVKKIEVTDSSDNECYPTNDNDDAFIPDHEEIKKSSKKQRRSPSRRKYEANEDPLAGKLTCPNPRCNTVYFSSDFSLQAHIRRVHEGDKKPFKCDCGKAFQYPTYLRVHQLSHTGEDKFYCKHCNKLLRSEKSLRVHEKTHTEEGKPFPCRQCEKRFANKQHLESHTISHQTDTIFTCETCGKTFRRERSMELHRRTHENPSAAYCTICKKTFSTDHSLKIHQEFHVQRASPRICRQCPYECFTRRDMKKHLKIEHTALTFHECQICGKQLSTKKALTTHLRTHTLEKLFNCSICKKAFKEETCKRRHETLHFKQTFMCEICGKSFAMQSYLSQHLKVHAKEPVVKLRKHILPDDVMNTNCQNENDVVEIEKNEVVVEIEEAEGEFECEYDENNDEEIVGGTDFDSDGLTAGQYTFAEVEDPHGEIQIVEVVAINE